jgi:hypothetical protein
MWHTLAQIIFQSVTEIKLLYGTSLACFFQWRTTDLGHTVAAVAATKTRRDDVASSALCHPHDSEARNKAARLQIARFNGCDVGAGSGRA